jgi:hypothetical protein
MNLTLVCGDREDQDDLGMARERALELIPRSGRGAAREHRQAADECGRIGRLVWHLAASPDVSEPTPTPVHRPPAPGERDRAANGRYSPAMRPSSTRARSEATASNRTSIRVVLKGTRAAIFGPGYGDGDGYPPRPRFGWKGRSGACWPRLTRRARSRAWPASGHDCQDRTPAMNAHLKAPPPASMPVIPRCGVAGVR